MIDRFHPMNDPQIAQLEYPDDESRSLRVPPHSIEAEQSVLGGLMLDNQAWDKIGDKIIEQDFYRADHRYIFSGISE